MVTLAPVSRERGRGGDTGRVRGVMASVPWFWRIRRTGASRAFPLPGQANQPPKLLGLGAGTGGGGLGASGCRVLG